MWSDGICLIELCSIAPESIQIRGDCLSPWFGHRIGIQLVCHENYDILLIHFPSTTI
jgi:hypothetical protein